MSFLFQTWDVATFEILIYLVLAAILGAMAAWYCARILMVKRLRIARRDFEVRLDACIKRGDRFHCKWAEVSNKNRYLADDVKTLTAKLALFERPKNKRGQFVKRKNKPISG